MNNDGTYRVVSVYPINILRSRNLNMEAVCVLTTSSWECPFSLLHENVYSHYFSMRALLRSCPRGQVLSKVSTADGARVLFMVSVQNHRQTHQGKQ